MVLNPLPTIKQRIMSIPLVELVFFMTIIITMLINSHHMKHIHSVILMATCVILLATGFYKTHWQAWAFILTVFALWVARIWYYSANHFYLHSYWLLACCIIAKADMKNVLLYHHGRMLVGLTMLTAGIQKLITVDFSSGGFLQLFMSLNKRFSFIPSFLGAISPEEIRAGNKSLSSTFLNSLFMDNTVTLPHSITLQTIALIESWGIILIETLIGVLFLFKFRRQLKFLRDYLLLIFIFGTYIISPPDAHFGMIFACMGLAQCPRNFPKLRLAYFASFIFLFFTQDIAHLIYKITL